MRPSRDFASQCLNNLLSGAPWHVLRIRLSFGSIQKHLHSYQGIDSRVRTHDLTTYPSSHPVFLVLTGSTAICLPLYTLHAERYDTKLAMAAVTEMDVGVSAWELNQIRRHACPTTSQPSFHMFCITFEKQKRLPALPIRFRLDYWRAPSHPNPLRLAPAWMLPFGDRLHVHHFGDLSGGLWPGPVAMFSHLLRVQSGRDSQNRFWTFLALVSFMMEEQRWNKA